MASNATSTAQTREIKPVFLDSSNSTFQQISNHAMLDLSYGGQFGWSPVLKEWINNQAYIRKNLICILLEAPKFFSLFSDGDKWTQILKSLVELHALTIEGLNAGLEVETDTHPVGGAGEVQHEYTNVKRAPSLPVFGLIEKYGMPIQHFINMWIMYGMQDPDTKFALINTLAKSTTNTSLVNELTADWYSASMLFMEPDPTHTRVIKSWVTTNMFPIGTATEIIGKYDKNSASEITHITLNFSGLSQFNLGSNVFAQTILDKINTTTANPYLRPSFLSGVEATVDVGSAYSPDRHGYQQGVQGLIDSIIQAKPPTHPPAPQVLDNPINHS